MNGYDDSETLFDLHLELGEGPSWDMTADQASLVDVLRGHI